MFSYIWRFYRWYDDLVLRGLGTTRFLLFIMPFMVCVIIINLWVYEYFTEPLPVSLSVLFLGVALGTRMYWHHSKIGKKYPSLVSKKYFR